MNLQELPTENIGTTFIGYRDDKCTPNALTTLAMRFYSIGISLQETVAALESFGVYRPHQAVFR